MEKISSNALNKLYIALAIITFVLSWIPKITEIYKILLLSASILLLIIIYPSPYFKIADKIENKIEEIEKRIEGVEDLINIKSDIKLLKYEVLGHE